VEFFQQRFREHVQKRTKGRRASDKMSQYRTLAATVKEPPCSAHLLAFALYPQSFYRSTSPNTISIVPMQATTSAIKRPSIIFGKACKFANEGARTWQRKGFGEPSLTM